MNEGRIKTWIEVVALLVGLILGSLSIYQQLRPSHALTADVSSAKAPLPPEFDSQLRALPEWLAKQLTDPDDKNPQNAPPPEAKAAAPYIKNIAKRQIHYLFFPTVYSEEVLIVNVRNNGNTALEAVQLGLDYPGTGEFVVQGPDGVRKTVKAAGIIDLGELRPQATSALYAWGFERALLMGGNIHLSHKGGRGEVREVRPVPSLVASGGGVWFSYRIAFFLLLSALLIGGAALMLARLRRLRQPNAKGGPA